LSSALTTRHTYRKHPTPVARLASIHRPSHFFHHPLPVAFVFSAHHPSYLSQASATRHTYRQHPHYGAFVFSTHRPSHFSSESTARRTYRQNSSPIARVASIHRPAHLSSAPTAPRIFCQHQPPFALRRRRSTVSDFWRDPMYVPRFNFNQNSRFVNCRLDVYAVHVTVHFTVMRTCCSSVSHFLYARYFCPRTLLSLGRDVNGKQIISLIHPPSNETRKNR
jgi:hypothetical protein